MLSNSKTMTHAEGRSKVQRAAFLSILAALFLTLVKLVVGVLDNSLGILSEAAHSGLDMVAAGITFIAVRRASKEPDMDHQYGHGKIENFAALVETIILWFTSIWIIYEAIRRIQLMEFPHPSIAGIIVMAMSILIDWERSRMLYRTAEEHGSQALEADALHFRTDMISSLVVLIGVCFVWLGLPIADPLAAIGVAIVIFIVSLNLGRRAFDILIDRAPPGLGEEIKKSCEEVPGVKECHRVRVRTSGPDMFIDLVVSIDEHVPISEAHLIADNIERSLEHLAPRVDAIVHMEPADDQNVHEYDEIYRVIQRLTFSAKDIQSVHNIRVQSTPEGVYVAADLELDPDLTVEVGHQIASRFETKLKDEFESIKNITLHLETTKTESEVSDITLEREDICKVVRRIVDEHLSAHNCHNIVINRDGHGITISFDCKIDGSISIEESHDVAIAIEKRVKQEIEDVSTVYVHLEPT